MPTRAVNSALLLVAKRCIFKNIQMLLKTVDLFHEDSFMVVSLILFQIPQLNKGWLLRNNNGKSKEQRLCKAESHYRSK